MTLLRQAARWLPKTLQLAAAEAVIYRRGEDDSDLTKAIPGRNVQALNDIEGEQQSEIEYDWMIAANELIIGGIKVEPEKGDVIIWNRPDGKTATYKVLPDASDRCYRDTDQFGILYRVHCKLIETVMIDP